MNIFTKQHSNLNINLPLLKKPSPKPKFKKKTSKNYLTDFAYIRFALGTLKAANRVEQDIDEKVPYVANYKSLEEQINTYIDELSKEFSDEVQKLSQEDLDFSDTISNQIIKDMVKYSPVNKHIYLELFAAYILFCRFIEKRKLKIDKGIENIVEKNRLFKLLNLIISISSVDEDEHIEEYKLAFQMVKLR